MARLPPADADDGSTVKVAVDPAPVPTCCAWVAKGSDDTERLLLPELLTSWACAC